MSRHRRDRRKELVAAEARALAGREQDADNACHRESGVTGAGCAKR
jgi:hypothetical protein